MTGPECSFQASGATPSPSFVSMAFRLGEFRWAPVPSEANCLQSPLTYPCNPFLLSAQEAGATTGEGYCPSYFTKGTVPVPGQAQVVFLISASTTGKRFRIHPRGCQLVNLSSSLCGSLACSSNAEPVARRCSLHSEPRAGAPKFWEPLLLWWTVQTSA